jgi:hypothetical protein
MEVWSQAAPLRARRQSRRVHCAAANGRHHWTVRNRQVSVAAPKVNDHGSGIPSRIDQPAWGNRRLLDLNPKTRSRPRGGLEVELSHPETVVTVTIPLAAGKSKSALVRKSASEESV